jgi:hypothetical protein
MPSESKDPGSAPEGSKDPGFDNTFKDQDWSLEKRYPRIAGALRGYETEPFLFPPLEKFPRGSFEEPLIELPLEKGHERIYEPKGLQYERFKETWEPRRIPTDGFPGGLISFLGSESTQETGKTPPQPPTE